MYICGKYTAMKNLLAIHHRLVENTDSKFVRYLYPKINWSNRLILIKGAKGTGKTTLMLQHIKKTFGDTETAIYASLDNIWFATHSIVDLAEYHYTHGGTHLFLDEIHKYRNWEQEIKNIYDSYPTMNVVITGSSMLKIGETMIADLSRRCRVYTLEGLSFREYLKIEGVADLPLLSLDEIFANHVKHAVSITAKTKVLHHFEKYLQVGYYPFYRESGDGFYDKLQTVLDSIIESEIPAVSKIEYDSVYKAKQLLGVMAETVPYTLNISNLCTTLSVSRNNLVKLLDLLDKASVIRRLYTETTGMKLLTKPEKILFANSNLMHALSSETDNGTQRETFVASQLCVEHKISMPVAGDFLVDCKYTLEVGGKGKGYKQIKGIKNSFVVVDDCEIGFENKIPMWLFGLMY